MRQNLIKKVFERCLSILVFIFPFVELSYYFGAKVFLSTDNLLFKSFYINSIQKLTNFYGANVYLIFILMVSIFLACSRGTMPLSDYARLNIIQAILINIICSCLGSSYSFLPIVLRESFLGILFANYLYLGLILLITYSSLLILYGRIPSIPVITEAAKMQVQRR